MRQPLPPDNAINCGEMSEDPQGKKEWWDICPCKREKYPTTFVSYDVLSKLCQFVHYNAGRKSTAPVTEDHPTSTHSHISLTVTRSPGTSDINTISVFVGLQMRFLL